MKVAPVSADLLIKLGLAAAVLGGVYLLLRKAQDALPTLPTLSSIEAATSLINPASDNNLVYQGVNAIGGALTGNDGFSLGSWIYDVTHPEPAPPAPPITSGGGGMFNGTGTTGSW